MKYVTFCCMFSVRTRWSNIDYRSNSCLFFLWMKLENLQWQDEGIGYYITTLMTTGSSFERRSIQVLVRARREIITVGDWSYDFMIIVIIWVKSLKRLVYYQQFIKTYQRYSCKWRILKKTFSKEVVVVRTSFWLINGQIHNSQIVTLSLTSYLVLFQLNEIVSDPWENKNKNTVRFTLISNFLTLTRNVVRQLKIFVLNFLAF